jgi:hypothetical protein
MQVSLLLIGAPAPNEIFALRSSVAGPRPRVRKQRPGDHLFTVDKHTDRVIRARAGLARVVLEATHGIAYDPDTTLETLAPLSIVAEQIAQVAVGILLARLNSFCGP